MHTLKSNAEPSLAIAALSFAWPSGSAVCQGWSGQLTPGLTVLVGGDGAGKTTRLRLLATACQPQSGQLTLTLPMPPTPRHVSLSAWPNPHAYRQHLFWCDPASDALDGLSASQYVAHHRAQQARWSDAVLADVLADMALAEHLHKPLLGLSMGMRRKLRLACALASGAPLTLMDDPLAALDKRSIDLVNDLLADCAASTRRVFVSTAYEPPEPELGAKHIAW